MIANNPHESGVICENPRNLLIKHQELVRSTLDICIGLSITILREMHGLITSLPMRIIFCISILKAMGHSEGC